MILVANDKLDRFFLTIYFALDFQSSQYCHLPGRTDGLPSSSIRHGHNVRWKLLSQMKTGLYKSAEVLLSPKKTQQAISGASATNYKLMKSHLNHYIGIFQITSLCQYFGSKFWP